MKKLTQAKIQNQADQVLRYYDIAEQDVFYKLIDVLNVTKPELEKAQKLWKNATGDSTAEAKEAIMDWRLKALSQMGGLTNQVVDLISKNAGISHKNIYKMIRNDGLIVARQMNRQLARTLHKPIVGVSSSTRAIIRSYASQAERGLNNYVNQSLLTRNVANNTACKTYQDIVNKSALEVISGIKTPERAVWDNIYKWRDAGLQSGLTDRGGHTWTIEGYSKMLIRNTTHRTYNDARMESMKQYDTVLCTMSAHWAARPACAPIQGGIVCIVPPDDPRYNDNYPSIYDYGYGDPGGTQGINCSHDLSPYWEGESHNFEKPKCSPEQAVKNMKIQQQQRGFERGVRMNKNKLQLAQKLGDDKGIAKYKAGVSAYQGKLRQIVKDNSFLYRDYANEKVPKL